VRWRPAGRGLFEIDGVPEAAVRHFSQRRVEIEERVVEVAGAASGGVLSRERMQGIALATRRPKRYAVDGAGWRDRARARAAEHGLGRAELDALPRLEPGPDVGPDPSRLAARLSGPGGLTARHNTFARRHALAEIAGAFPHGAGVAELEAATDRYLAHPTVRPLDRAPGREARFTTEGLLGCERAIVEGAQRRRSEPTGIVDRTSVEKVLAARKPALNVDQAAAIRAITSSGHGLDTIRALAGTGKTTMLGALAACYRHAGRRVIGAAPTARAARELREIAQVPSTTMHRLVSELDRAGGFEPGTVLVIDEAGMAATRVSADLLGHAERAGVKVIAVGDPGQLASVQAGGWLAALSRRQPGPELSEIIRQRDASERNALRALHDGRPDAYLAHKHDQISVHATENEAVDALADQWDAARREHGHGNAVMIARDNYTRELLNRAARGRLKRDGTLPPGGVLVGRREYAPGDRVIARRNDRARDIDNGTVGTVIDIDRRTRRMLLQTDTGQRRDLDLVYIVEHVEHAYALTGHGAQGATVTWAGVIGRAEEFTREWAYTALSRARDQTTLHIIGEQPPDELERRHYAPYQPDRDRAQTLTALRRAMKRAEAEPLAVEHSAHQELVKALTRYLPLSGSVARQDRLPQPPAVRYSSSTTSRWPERSPPQAGLRLSR
jgi:hypothetical protein